MVSFLPHLSSLPLLLSSFLLGGLLLLRLREVAAAEEEAVAAAVACLLLQQKVNCSSPSHVSRVRSAHLLSCTHPLYKFRRVANGWEEQCLSGGELLVLPTGGCTPTLPTTSAQEGAIVGGEWCGYCGEWCGYCESKLDYPTQQDSQTSIL